MTKIELDRASDVAPYEQVRVQIARMVTSGALQPGAKLPTVRHLAADLNLAVNTVARAFRELEADGVIVTQGRRGSFVNSLVLAGDDSALDADVTRYASRARAQGLSLSEATRLLERAWTRP